MGDNSYGHPTEDALRRPGAGRRGDLPDGQAGYRPSICELRRHHGIREKDIQGQRGLSETEKRPGRGNGGERYIFYGEETYLREYYLKELRKKLVPAGFEEFNYHTLEGKDLTVQTLAETAEAMPMMAERTLIVVSDFDLFKLNEEQREKLIAFLEDVPPYCCVVFLYDTVEYEPNRTMKKLYKAVTDHVEAVEFRPADNSDLVVWIAPAVQGPGEGDRPSDGGVPDLHLRRSDDGAGAGDRKDRRLCQRQGHHPEGHRRCGGSGCCRRRCSACPTRCSRGITTGRPASWGIC